MSTRLFARQRPGRYLVRRLLFPTKVNRALQNSASLLLYLQDLIQDRELLAGLNALAIVTGAVLGGFASKLGMTTFVVVLLTAHLLSAITEESNYALIFLRTIMTVANRFFGGIVTGALFVLVSRIGWWQGGLGGSVIAILLLIITSYGLKQLSGDDGRLM